MVYPYLLTNLWRSTDPRWLWPSTALASLLIHGLLFTLVRFISIDIKEQQQIVASPLPIQLVSLPPETTPTASEHASQPSPVPQIDEDTVRQNNQPPIEPSLPLRPQPYSSPMAQSTESGDSVEPATASPTPAASQPSSLIPPSRSQSPSQVAPSPDREAMVPLPERESSPTFRSPRPVPQPVAPPSAPDPRPSVEPPPFPKPPQVSPPVVTAPPNVTTPPTIEPSPPQAVPPPLSSQPPAEPPVSQPDVRPPQATEPFQPPEVMPPPGSSDLAADGMGDGRGGQLTASIRLNPNGRDIPETPPRIQGSNTLALQPLPPACSTANLSALTPGLVNATIQLEVLVEADGRVSAANVISGGSSGNTAVDSLASCLVRERLSLIPAYSGGQPIRSDAFILEARISF